MIWGFMFILCMIINSIACGMVMVKLHQKANNSSAILPTFWLGASLTPGVLATWIMLIAFCPSFCGKQYFSAFFPSFISLLLIYNNRQLLFFSAQKIKSELCRGFDLNCFIAVNSLIIIFVYFVYSICGISGVELEYDASFYFAEALKFVQTLSFRDFALYADFPDGSLPGTVHNFLWPAYISYGLLFTTPGNFGFHHDLAAYLAVSATLVFLILALLSLGILISKCKGLAYFAGLFLFLSPFQHIVRNDSRDFFRCIPIIALLTLLYEDISDEKTFEMKSQCFLLFFVTWFSIGGHPINVFSLINLGFVWIMIKILKKERVEILFLQAASMALGVLAASYNFLYSLYKTGTLSGYCSLYMENIAPGSNFEKAYLRFYNRSMYNGGNLFGLFRQIFREDSFHIVVVTAVLSIVFLSLRLYKIKKTKMFIFLTYLIHLAMIIGGSLVSWGGFTFSEWLSKAPRYSYHYYVLAIPCLLLILDWFLGKLYLYRDSLCILRGALPYLVLPVSLCVLAYTFWVSDLNNVKEYEYERFESNGKIVLELQNKLNFNENLLLADNRYSYLTGLHSKCLASYFGRDLFYAKTEDEVLAFFRKEKIRYLCLNTNFTERYYADSPFYLLLPSLIQRGCVKEIYPSFFEINL